MSVLLALAVAVLFGGGIYLLLQRSFATIVLGLAMLGHGANLGVFVAGGLTRGAPPLVAAGATAPPPGSTDPLPQALVLTAIVIGFAFTAFAAALVIRSHRKVGTDDVDAMRSTDT